MTELIDFSRSNLRHVYLDAFDTKYGFSRYSIQHPFKSIKNKSWNNIMFVHIYLKIISLKLF